MGLLKTNRKSEVPSSDTDQSSDQSCIASSHNESLLKAGNSTSSEGRSGKESSQCTLMEVNVSSQEDSTRAGPSSRRSARRSPRAKVKEPSQTTSPKSKVKEPSLRTKIQAPSPKAKVKESSPKAKELSVRSSPRAKTIVPSPKAKECSTRTSPRAKAKEIVNISKEADEECDAESKCDSLTVSSTGDSCDNSAASSSHPPQVPDTDHPEETGVAQDSPQTVLKCPAQGHEDTGHAHGQRDGEETESHGQRAGEPTETHGQRDGEPTESHGQRDGEPTESHGQRDGEQTESHGKGDGEQTGCLGQEDIGQTEGQGCEDDKGVDQTEGHAHEAVVQMENHDHENISQTESDSHCHGDIGQTEDHGDVCQTESHGPKDMGQTESRDPKDIGQAESHDPKDLRRTEIHDQDISEIGGHGDVSKTKRVGKTRRVSFDPSVIAKVSCTLRIKRVSGDMYESERVVETADNPWELREVTDAEASEPPQKQPRFEED